MAQNNDIGGGLMAIVTGVAGLAVIAVLASKNSQTAAVITSFGNGLANVIRSAISPVTGR